jgi:hypothetical protein
MLTVEPRAVTLKLLTVNTGVLQRSVLRPDNFGLFPTAITYSLFLKYMQLYQFITRTTCMQLSPFNTCQISSLALLRALLRWSLYVSHFQPYDLSNIELLTCV